MTSVEDFHTMLKDAGDKPVFVMFTASWCPPCKMIKPTFIKASKEVKSCQFVIVDIKEGADIAQECDVKAMPTFKVFVNQKESESLIGASESVLKRLISKYKS